MRILHLATSLNGGAGSAAYRSHEALIDSGFHSKILTLTHNNEIHKNGVIATNRKSLDRLASGINTKLQSLILQSSSNLLTPISISQLNLTEPAILEANIIHAHASYNFFNLSDLIALSRMNKKIFVTLHDQRFFTGGCHYSYECRGFQNSCKRCPQARIVGRRVIDRHLSDNAHHKSQISQFKFISPSTWLSRLAKESQLLSEAAMRVIFNPVPNDFYTAIGRNNEKKLLTLGFCSADLNNPYKGLNLLSEALHIISMTNPDRKFQLNLIGIGKLISFSENVSVAQIRVSSQAEIAQELSRLDYLVVPSTADNAPSVISEALMCGTPVLGSSTGGIPEMLNNGNGMIFTSENAEDLAQKILTFNIPATNEAIAKSAKAKYGYSIVAKNLMDYYGSN
ncbi:glycosyltransferase [Candidatus Planktophila lacus]|uniref:glycosyltransferase n=1 Tax=Candidatus Planktophila lacus TaxID=1884913 RepID=UPI000BAC88C5|nr:glycosyltransferase [Candidatus Planktophila lacus]ASY28465.1 glycosyltransferase [Candidatus Planktophila lacus]